jgi:hypothetical protein
MSVNLEVLHVPDCPNLVPLLDRLRQVTGLPITSREITTDAEATARGMAGSPTLLINGADPFAEPGRCDCGVSCRIYHNEHGWPVAAPTVAQLREVLAAAGAAPATEQTSVPVPRRHGADM